MDEIKGSEERTEVLRAENEVLDQEVSKAQKKKAIREAKEMYGSDWKKMIGGAVRSVGKLRVNSEAMQNLHSLGFGGERLREMNDPRTFRK